MKVVPCFSIITGKAFCALCVAIEPDPGQATRQRRIEARPSSVTRAVILKQLSCANKGHGRRSRDPAVV